MTIRVVVADDQAVVRAGFRTILESEEDIVVVAEASDGAAAVAAARRHRPDLVLMDVRMPGTDGIAATRQLAGATVTDPVRVLVVTTFDLDEYVFAALRAGATGFLLKDTEPDDLVAAVRVVAAGDGLVAPTVTRRLIAEFARLSPAPVHPPGRLSVLTEREHEILLLIAKGLSNAEIADTLVVSASTVKTHVGNVLAKLDCRESRTGSGAGLRTGCRPPRHLGVAGHDVADSSTRFSAAHSARCASGPPAKDAPRP